MLHFFRQCDSLHPHILYQKSLQEPTRNSIILIHFQPCFFKQSDDVLHRYNMRKPMQVLEYKPCNKKLIPLILSNIIKQHANGLLSHLIKLPLPQKLINKPTSSQFLQSNSLLPHPLQTFTNEP